MLHSFIMTIGAFSMIFDTDDRILLCHRRDKDMWNLPGGMVEENESPWHAAIREAQEEIGVKIQLDMLHGVYYKPEQNDLVFSFVASIVGGTPLLSDEVDTIAYFSLASLPQNIAPKQKERIIAYWQSRNGITVYEIQQ